MVLAIAALVGALGLGFGLGRIKNAAKLAAIKAELVKIEGKAVVDFAAVVAKIKSLLP